MASDPQTIAWERLAAPPRHVPLAVQARVRSAEIKNALYPPIGSGFVGLWFLLAGFLTILFGTAWFYGADEELYPIIGVFLAAAGISIWIVLGALIFVRGTRKIHLLRNGVTAQGTITRVPYGLSLITFEDFVKEWEVFRPPERMDRFHSVMVSGVHSQLKFLPCEVRVTIGDADRNCELKVRLDLSSMATHQPRDAKIRVLWCAK